MYFQLVKFYMMMKKSFRCFFIALGFIILAFSARADHITVQGEVSGQWDCDTVFVEGNLLIPDGMNLSIAPGTRVVFNGVFDLRVEGCLQAVGLPVDSIYFTMADTTGFHIDTLAVGGWGGIRFDHNRTSNDSSLFSYCRFEFGKIADPDPEKGNGGALSINDFNKVRINHCLFTDNFSIYNGGAVYLDSANVVIENSVFLRNKSGLSVAPWGYGGGICSDNSEPEIRWNVFEDNLSTGVGGGLAVRFKDCDVYNNIFSENLSGLGGGLGVLHITDIYHRVNNNLIANNEAIYFGGGVASLDASPIYANNTISNNQAMYGGGFYCKDSVSPDFFNTIIWGNTASVGSQGYLFEVYSQADFFNCDVQGGPMLFGGSGGGEAFFGAYEDCIDADPLYIGGEENPFSLQWDSPCYDAGSWDTTGLHLPEYELAGNPRISHACVDIGAYEIIWVGIEAWGLGGMEAWGDVGIEVWPNPTIGKFNVKSSKCQVGLLSLELLDVYGNVLLKPDCELRTADCELDISHLPDGIYLLLIYSEKQVVCKKLVKSSSQSCTN